MQPLPREKKQKHKNSAVEVTNFVQKAAWPSFVLFEEHHPYAIFKNKELALLLSGSDQMSTKSSAVHYCLNLLFLD